MSALFPPSTGTDSVPFPAFLGGITAYGSYTKGGSIGGWGISKSVCTGLSWFNRIRAGVYGLHRTGPGRSAWTVSEDRQSVRFSLQRHKARPQGQQGIYTHLISYHVPILGQTLDPPEQLRSCYSTWPREFCHCPLQATDGHTLEYQVYLSRSTVRSHMFKCLALMRPPCPPPNHSHAAARRARYRPWKLVQICI